MEYTSHYESPLGSILLAADEQGLTGLWFTGQKYYAQGLDENHTACNRPVFDTVWRWLDIYFAGREPEFMPPIHMTGSDFQMEVWNILRQIPYGETVTYGEIARKVAARRGLTSMSAQAVGGAVGHNKISILIPCHRVIGRNGRLTGYAGGMEKKKFLLTLER